MLVDFGKAYFIEKVRRESDKVKIALDKVKSDSLSPTIETIRDWS